MTGLLTLVNVAFLSRPRQAESPCSPLYANPPFWQCYRDRETRENLVPCSQCPAWHTATFRMPETWREEEQDACSSCSSHPPLESSNKTEIITVSKACIPSVPSKIESTFLIERLLESYRRAMERFRLGQEDGGDPSSVPQELQDNNTQDTQDKH